MSPSKFDWDRTEAKRGPNQTGVPKHAFLVFLLGLSLLQDNIQAPITEQKTKKQRGLGLGKLSPDTGSGAESKSRIVVLRFSIPTARYILVWLREKIGIVIYNIITSVGK